MGETGSGIEQGKNHDRREDRNAVGKVGRNPDSGSIDPNPPGNLSERKSEVGRVEVEIFGQTYNIVGGDNPERIANVAKFVDARMEEIAKQGKGMSALKIAILVALNITDQLLQFQENNGKFIQKGDYLISMLKKAVDE